MPSLIPTIIGVNAADDGVFYLSNDPYFSSVSLLLHFDADFTDSSKYRHTLSAIAGSPTITTTTPKFGAGSYNQASTAFPQTTGEGIVITQGSELDILSGSGDFTIDGWFWYTGSTPGAFTILDYGNDQVAFSGPGASTGLNIAAQFVSGLIGIQVNTAIKDSVTTATWAGTSGAGVTGPTHDGWVHFAVVRSAGIGIMFVNGQIAAQSTATWLHYTFPTTTTSLATIGRTATVSGASATGKVDELRVTKGVARWTTAFTPPTAPADAIPVHRGYSDGTTIETLAFGSTSPAPPLVDTDLVSVVQDYVTGTYAAPSYHFQVVMANGQMFQDDLTSISFIDKDSVQQNLLASAATFDGTNGDYGVWTWATTKLLFGPNTSYPVTFIFEDPNVDFNCDCEMVSPYDTLANVRTKMLIRLGYPNQLVNPPPGMATLIDQFLRDAQDELYMQLQRAALRTERFYRWTMVPGQRYYGLDASEGTCDATLNPYKVTWVGFEDLNKAWYRMDEGIPPEYYTRANINFGWPTRFEIRSCIEIFPAPQAAYTLWIKGDFGVSPLVEDTDRFTLEDKLVFLLALGNAKTHYGQKDAQAVLQQAANYTRSIVAGSHGTKRYVPRSGEQNALTPPRFLPLGSDQA